MPTTNTGKINYPDWPLFWRAAVLLFPLIAPALTFASPQITVAHGRIRLLPGGLPLAGYFDLVNDSNQRVTLVDASSPVFRTVELHRSSEKDGMSSMISVRRIEVIAGRTFHFSPDGYHLMLMGRRRSLRVGDKVPVTLQFSGDKTLQVIFKIEGADSQ